MLDRAPQRAWATPLEVLLLAERAALLANSDDEFTMLITLGYTGMRWGEMIGLERDLLQPTLINVEWQLREIKGCFHRLPPKDDSYRSTNYEPLLPVDLPLFLAGLLAAQAGKHTRQRCACAAGHGGSGRYVFLGPDGGHYRRSNYARRIFRPACDGRYTPANGSPGRLVISDTTSWPGVPATSWPPAVARKPFTPPTGRGMPRLISTGDTGRCPTCGYAVRLRLDGTIIAHKIDADHCPGSGEPPAEDTPLACWLPVKDGLTPHGFRHSHKTWMTEDGISEVLAEQRLGHQVPGMRGLYAHASQPMRDELTAALQARWEKSLRDRAEIDPHSPVPLLDNLLAPFRVLAVMRCAQWTARHRSRVHKDIAAGVTHLSSAERGLMRGTLPAGQIWLSQLKTRVHRDHLRTAHVLSVPKQALITAGYQLVTRRVQGRAVRRSLVNRNAVRWLPRMVGLMVVGFGGDAALIVRSSAQRVVGFAEQPVVSDHAVSGRMDIRQPGPHHPVADDGAAGAEARPDAL